MVFKKAQDVTKANDTPADVAQERHGLRRAVGVWGSYTWGYADVGADVYVALGIVMAAAQGATNVAFPFAGLVYVMVGLAYTDAERDGTHPRRNLCSTLGNEDDTYSRAAHQEK